MSLTMPLWAVWSLLVGAVSVGITFMTATVYFVNTLNTINSKLDRAGGDRWTLSFERYKDDRMRYENPGIKIPDADEVAKRLGGQ